MSTEENFDKWFDELCEVAENDGAGHLIEAHDKESYREYFDDGDAPEEAYYLEFQKRMLQE